MSWTIILEDEHNQPITMLNNEFEISSKINLDNFSLICYLDPYGDTSFNHLQMDNLIKDIKNLEVIEYNPILEEIKMLAIRCKNEEHTYLVFYGD